MSKMASADPDVLAQMQTMEVGFTYILYIPRYLYLTRRSRKLHFDFLLNFKSCNYVCIG
jgi:hypothetical protein